MILHYVKRRDVRGTWLESHFRWQIRTFWYGLLWFSTLLPWATDRFLYRIGRGWLAVNNHQPMDR